MEFQRLRFRCAVIATVVTLLISTTSSLLENPKFSEPIKNVTVPVGREAIFTCVIEDLGAYKVAWVRVDTQTILTIQHHVITRNSRISVSHTGNATWHLHIRNVGQYDRGWYMCQINTDAMKSQLGYLDVVVPPDILDFGTSSDTVAMEGSSVTLKCEANGYPKPRIVWRREGGEILNFKQEQGTYAYQSVLMIDRVHRHDMGPYLCIASNGIPPTVSKRIMLTVNFLPMIQVENQLLGTFDGLNATLECYCEAFPKSINYWAGPNGEMIVQNVLDNKFHSEIISDKSYKVHMKLTIVNVSKADYGNYHCVCKNIVGEADALIKLHRIQNSSIVSNLSKNSVYQADLSQQDSLFLEGGNYSVSERDHVNRLLLGTTLILVTLVKTVISNLW